MILIFIANTYYSIPAYLNFWYRLKNIKNDETYLCRMKSANDRQANQFVVMTLKTT